MPRFSLFLIIAIIAAIQCLSFPGLNFFGSPLPLVIVSLTLISFRKVDMLPWLGLLAGLIIDMTIGGSLGVWTTYYLAVCLIARWLLGLPKIHWWWRLLWIGGSTAIAPIYAQILTGQTQFKYWPELTLLPALVLVAIVAIPCWLWRRQPV